MLRVGSLWRTDSEKTDVRPAEPSQSTRKVRLCNIRGGTVPRRKLWW